MSKCDLAVLFDRADRMYRGGETIRGTVEVRVNRNIGCNGVILEHFWQTHGFGRPETRSKQKIVLHEGELRSGQLLSYPFELTAPSGPPTYHGQRLKIDHYVKARVDIRWAIAPKVQERYVLLPGEQPYAELPVVAGKAGSTRKEELIGTRIGVGLVVVGLLTFPCGLLPVVAGAVCLVFSARRILAERKLGEVQLTLGTATVRPGGTLSLRLSFTPRSSFRLHRIVATVEGRERCGSEKQSHTFYSQAHQIVFGYDVTAGRLVDLDAELPVPETTAHSFDGSGDEISWKLKVRIHIPLWPDWMDKRTLVVGPSRSVKPGRSPAVRDLSAPEGLPERSVPVLPPLESPQPESASPELAVRIAEKPGVGQEEPLLAAGAEMEPSAAAPSSSDPALIAVVGRLRSANRYNGETEQIVEQETNTPFGCLLEVQSVSRTYSYVPDARFRDGRTVTGTIVGTDCRASVQFPESRNDALDALDQGDRLPSQCHLLKWDTIRDRLEMREI